MASTDDRNIAGAEEQPQAAGKKAKKPPKRSAREVKAKRGKKEKGAKKKKPGLVGAIVVIALVAAAGAMYYYNLLGVKSKVVGFFVSQDTQYAQKLQTMDRAEADANAAKEEYNSKQLELADLEQTLADREQALTAREAELEEQSAAANTVNQVDGTVQKSKVVLLYENMTTEEAAAILNRTVDNGWIADLLRSMDEKTAAKILALLDIDKAIAITGLMSQ